MTIEQLQAMSDEQKRIRIAELCGWTKEPAQNDWSPMEWWWKSPGGVVAQPSKPETHLPDYLNDLNAIQREELILRANGHGMKYAMELAGVIKRDSFTGEDEPTALDFIYATAPQRAEAFLLTLG